MRSVYTSTKHSQRIRDCRNSDCVTSLFLSVPLQVILEVILAGEAVGVTRALDFGAYVGPGVTIHMASTSCQYGYYDGYAQVVYG